MKSIIEDTQLNKFKDYLHNLNSVFHNILLIADAPLTSRVCITREKNNLKPSQHLNIKIK